MDGPLFDYQRPLAGVLGQAHERIKAEVRGEPEGYVRDADAEQWAEYLAEKHASEPPVLAREQQQVQDLGEREVDATGMDGITFKPSEWGRPIIRPGREFRLVIPVEGDAELLRYGPAGGVEPVEAHLEEGVIYRRWAWPIELGSKALDDKINQVVGALQSGAATVAAEVEKHNAALPKFAAKVIAERRQELERHREFLAGLSVPVQRREDAPKPFSPPPIVRRKPHGRLTPKPEPVSGPALGQFYEDILDVIRPTGRAMERVPADFADRHEDRLRDHLLVALNAQYQGQATGETFNHAGKTDLLLRVQDHNAFIGECKWWSGVRGLGKALEQLLGYSTWRDSRLALIFFVRAQDPTAIVQKAGTALAERAEFDGWEPISHEKELRCRIRWPNDPGRTAVLTLLFFHVPNRE
jgi:hypothetical protein